MRRKWKTLQRPCRVYWGTHACRKQRGHLGKHLCRPGCPYPGPDTHLWGEDVHYPFTEPPPDIAHSGYMSYLLRKFRG